MVFRNKKCMKPCMFYLKMQKRISLEAAPIPLLVVSGHSTTLLL